MRGGRAQRQPSSAAAVDSPAAQELVAAVQRELAAGAKPDLAALNDGYFKVSGSAAQGVCTPVHSLATSPRASQQELRRPRCPPLHHKSPQGVIKNRGLRTPEVDAAVARVMQAHQPAVAAAARAAGEALLREPLQARRRPGRCARGRT